VGETDVVGHPDPITPKGVVADAGMTIIMLTRTFVAETIKGRGPYGVPLAVNVILAVSELTLRIYFEVVLVRAVGHAFAELDKVRHSLEGTRPWQFRVRSPGCQRAITVRRGRTRAPGTCRGP
jgi:hypothetical protein